MNSLFPYIFLDVILLFFIGFLLLRRKAFCHPLFVYLFFHVYSVTIRGIELYLGAPPMYSDILSRGDITIDEMEMAYLFSLISLVSFVVATTLIDYKKHPLKAHSQYIRLSPKIVSIVCYSCLPIGVAFLYFTRAGILTDGYSKNIALWAISSLCMLVFLKGFKKHLVVLIVMYLSFVMLQGFHRFMFILPIFFLVAVYLQKNNMRWPSKKMILLGFLLILVFPQMKHVGRAVQKDDFHLAYENILEIFNFDIENSKSKGQFFDQMAGAISMADDYGERLYGSTYLSVLTLPIPKSIWAEKPSLAEHLKLISTEERPFDKEGRIITYVGEAYLNFGFLGVFIVPFLLGLILTKWYKRATSGNFFKLDRYIYTVFFVALIQVFRDGLSSFVMFTIVQNMPMLFTLLLHLLYRKKLKQI